MQPIPDPRELRPGERLAGLPASSVNAGIRAYRELRRQPWARKGRPSSGGGSGGAGGTSSQAVRVYDDISDGASVRCLVADPSSSWAVDTDAAFVTAVPVDSKKVLTLGATGCCGDGVAVPAGITINHVGRHADADGDLVVSGGGIAANPSVSVTVTISDGTTDKTPTVTNNGDGTWTAAAVNLSASTALNAGLVTITATDSATTQVVAFQYDGATTPSGTPLAPDAPKLSGGGSATDDTTPTMLVTSKDSQDPTGPIPDLMVNGAIVATTETRDVNFFASALVDQELTPSSALTDPSRVTVQVRLWFDNSPSGAGAEDRYSAVSPPLVLRVDSSTPPATRVHRRGLTTTIGAVTLLTYLGDCSYENSTAENTKLDA